MTPAAIQDQFSQPPDLLLPYPLQYPYPASDASSTPPPDYPPEADSPQEPTLDFTGYPCISQMQYPPSATDSAFGDNIFMTSPVDSSEYPPPPYSLVAVPGLPGTSSPVEHMPSSSSQSGVRHAPLDPRPRGESFAPGRPSRVENIAHPYARLYTKKEGTKRRKMWNHALEKALFTPQEISTMGAPQRRMIYTASLEAHVDRLHAQLLDYNLYPVPFETLKCFCGLNSTTAKSMVSGLYYDATELRLKRLELERSINIMRNMLLAPPAPAILREGDAMPPPFPGMRDDASA